MMDGYASRADLNLTAEQRGKIAEIRNDVRRKHWDLMGKMQDEQAQMNERYHSDQRDDAPLSKSYRDMSELRPAPDPDRGSSGALREAGRPRGGKAVATDKAAPADRGAKGWYERAQSKGTGKGAGGSRQAWPDE